MNYLKSGCTVIAHQLYNEFMALLLRLYPQRLGDILHQHFAFSTAMNISEKLPQVDRLKGWLDSFRPLSPTLVAESILKQNCWKTSIELIN